MDLNSYFTPATKNYSFQNPPPGAVANYDSFGTLSSYDYMTSAGDGSYIEFTPTSCTLYSANGSITQPDLCQYFPATPYSINNLPPGATTQVVAGEAYKYSLVPNGDVLTVAASNQFYLQAYGSTSTVAVDINAYVSNYVAPDLLPNGAPPIYNHAHLIAPPV